MVPPVVDADWVAAQPGVVLADVRWYPDGRSPKAEYALRHLPGAVLVDLDRCLSGHPTPAGGRHPLPSPADFATRLGGAGIGDADTVVGYDDAGGAIAARLVWMLRSLGLPAALLDGGLRAWGGPLAQGDEPRRRPAHFSARPWPPERLAGIDEVAAVASASRGKDRPTGVVLDARAAERYAGGADHLDPRPGHIPGARNVPWGACIDADGRLLPVAALRERLATAGVGSAGPAVIASCGSGVTACHTLLVLEHAGLPSGRLFPGSWSQWSRSDRPAAIGTEP